MSSPSSSTSGRFKRRNRVCKTQTQPGSSTAPPPSTRIPDEIFSQIARYTLGHVWSDLDVMDPSSSMVKPPFSRIEGMTRASRRLRTIALPEWFRLFIVRHVEDWFWAGRLRGMRAWVRHIICPPHALEQPATSTVLSSFPHLRSAALSMSCDYELNLHRFSAPRPFYANVSDEPEDRPVFDYRQPVTTFPPTMTSLAVRSTHGSETPLLQNLGLYCPDLRILRLGKCTMFNSCTAGKCSTDYDEGYYGQIADGGECPFWGTFAGHHDMYFGDDNVEQYAYELAAELGPLQKLEEISFGVYLSPIAALEEHRLAHYPWRHLETSQAATQAVHLANNIPNPATPTTSTTPIAPMPTTPPPVAFPFSTSQMAPPQYANPTLWSYDCSACRKSYATPTAVAERAGGLILAAALPRLRKIEWASFFESQSQEGEGYRRGTGTHEWRVIRDEAGAVLDLERVNL